MANLAPMEREIKKYIKWKFIVDPIKILCLLPLSHVFGQMIGIFLPRMLGAEVVFKNRLNPSEVIETIKRERVMIGAAVPRILETLESKIERDYESGRLLHDFHNSLTKERSWLGAWWKYRRIHRTFGWKFVGFVTGGATLDTQTENFWSASIIRFLPDAVRLGRYLPAVKIYASTRTERSLFAARISRRVTGAKRGPKGRMSGLIPATSARWTRRAVFISKAVKKMSL